MKLAILSVVFAVLTVVVGNDIYGWFLGTHPNLPYQLDSLYRRVFEGNGGMPKGVYVRGELWRIHQVTDLAIPDNGSVYTGVTDCKEHEILIQIYIPQAIQRETLIHELLHAGTCFDNDDVHNLYWNSKTEEGHEGIYKLGWYLSDLLKENPELTAYLGK